MRGFVILSFCLLIFAWPQSLSAQGEIIKSTEIVQDIEGNNYYLHKVSKGENLYRIAEAYGVSVDEISKSNAIGLDQGIKLGQEIKIPIGKSKTVGGQDEIKQAPKGYKYHQVAKGETLYRITIDYQVSIEDLEKVNPGLTTNINEGQLILIPTHEQLIAEIAAEKYDSLEPYEIQKKDTYYRLEKKFKLNQQQFEQLNPQLKTLSLQKGMIILVPVGYKKEEIIPEYQPIVLDPVLPNKDFENKSNGLKENGLVIVDNQQVYKIGFMIPLFTNLNHEIKVQNEYLIKKDEDYKSFRFIEFLQGALMALDSLEKLGLKAEVYIWDTQAKTSKIDSICALKEFQELDILIGPFYSDNIKRVQKYTSQYHVKLVDLFSAKANTVDSLAQQFIIKSDQQNNYQSLVKYINDSIPNYRISIIHQGRTNELSKFNKLNAALQANSGIDTNRIHVYNYSSGGFNTLLNDLNSSAINVIFNLVEDEARISNFLRQLSLKKKTFNIMVMGQEQDWSKFTTIEEGYLSDLHYTYSTDYYVDYSDSSSVIPFENKFYNKNARIPGKLAYLGFDVSWFFGNAIYYYGINFGALNNQFDFKGMHNNFKFVETREGIYLNKSINIIQYNEYQIIIKN